ncbi:MAG: hypothetical protein E7672_03405 [Ruminococcaceae bacterium]|nr:hypothetical protein [Oscillospiraceae bacterium]
MTLIEIFDKTPIENIISSLALKPDRVIFVGSDYRKVSRDIPVYQDILAGRGIKIDMSAKSVVKNDIDDIVDSLAEIISDPDETYIVDISGGDEGTLVAVGMILGSDTVHGKKVCAFRINVVSRHGVMYYLEEKDGIKKLERDVYDFSYKTQVYLTAEENVKLNGGKVFGKGIAFEKGDPVERDIDAMWEICCRNPSDWNYKIGKLSSVVSRLVEGEDVFIVHRDSIGKGRNCADEKLWNELVSQGLVIIDRERSARGAYVFRYKNPITQECLNKAGSVLEYITYKTAIYAEEDEIPLFDSAEVGIVIGWDEEPAGTRNEIDCMLMRGCVPIFISCKNGDVKTDELYKLETVADKFGQEYGKKVLLSTVYFDEAAKSYDGDRATQTLKARAEDMNIRLISKVHLSNKNVLAKEISKLIH